jgi:hypothetical protein
MSQQFARKAIAKCWKMTGLSQKHDCQSSLADSGIFLFDPVEGNQQGAIIACSKPQKF